MPVLQGWTRSPGRRGSGKLNFTQVEVEFEKRAAEFELGEVLFESAGLGCLKGTHAAAESGGPRASTCSASPRTRSSGCRSVRNQVVEQVFRTEREVGLRRGVPAARTRTRHRAPPDGYRWAVVRIDPSSPEPYTGRHPPASSSMRAAWRSGRNCRGCRSAWSRPPARWRKVAGDQGVDLIGMLAQRGLRHRLAAALRGHGGEARRGACTSRTCSRRARPSQNRSSSRASM